MPNYYNTSVHCIIYKRVKNSIFGLNFFIGTLIINVCATLTVIPIIGRRNMQYDIKNCYFEVK